MINKAHIKIGDVVYGSSDSVDIMYDENTNVYDKITNMSNTMAYIDIEDNENVEFEGTIIGPTLGLVDNLESTSTTSALSANQGSVLKGYVDELNEDVEILNSNVESLRQNVNTQISELSSNKADNSDVTSLIDMVNELETNFENSKLTVVDNLTSTNTTSALSANQGKVLNTKITSLNSKFNNSITDLNNAVENGFYSYESSALNNPASYGGSLLVIKCSTNYFTQVAYVNSSDNSQGVYRRTHGANGFTEWIKDTRFENVAIVTKQSGSFVPGSYTGSITNDTRRVLVEFPKPFTKIPTVACGSSQVPSFKYTFEEIKYSYFVVNVIYPGGAGLSSPTVSWVAEMVE